MIHSFRQCTPMLLLMLSIAYISAMPPVPGQGKLYLPPTKALHLEIRQRYIRLLHYMKKQNRLNADTEQALIEQYNENTFEAMQDIHTLEMKKYPEAQELYMRSFRRQYFNHQLDTMPTILVQ